MLPIRALSEALAPEIYQNATLFVFIWHTDTAVASVDDVDPFT